MLIQEASKRQSLVNELDRHRSILAQLQETLQRVKAENRPPATYGPRQHF